MNFKNYSQMLNEAIPAGQIDPKSEDPRDPTVYISGFGTMLLSQLKTDVEQKLGDLHKRSKRGDFEMAWYQISGKNGLSQILPHKLQAIKDADEAMNKPQWKRRITNFKKGR
tara:strand:- start:792 stop:1127 length:336 start_codon:yes stop_codon:yes gene_type:complete